MCNKACLAYGRAQLAGSDIRGRRVIEVGARDFNGSLRSYVSELGPSRYVGVDIDAGPGVDVVCDAEDLVARFGPESFDLVICTEVLEHVRDWRVVISNLKRLAAPGGVVLVTTRSIGFPYHAFPHDFWRYEPDDMRAIFSDFAIESVESDPGAPGVFMKARRGADLVERDLADYELYSMVRAGRVREPGRLAELRFTTTWRLRRFVGRHLPERMKSMVKRSGSSAASA